jgi:hypothetical protein
VLGTGSGTTQQRNYSWADGSAWDFEGFWCGREPNNYRNENEVRAAPAQPARAAHQAARACIAANAPAPHSAPARQLTGASAARPPARPPPQRCAAAIRWAACLKSALFEDMGFNDLPCNKKVDVLCYKADPSCA